MNNQKITEALKLKAVDLESIALKLKELTTANPMVPALAYEGAKAEAALSCSCKGCEGCTSW
ncbi:hypothetical protein [Catenibacterium mitsuokai]|uniref:hypothetical protein n=1 Tax=Catenibacterium mitsuokai TaxID=100886 RepID=UPI003F8C679F